MLYLVNMVDSICLSSYIELFFTIQERRRTMEVVMKIVKRGKSYTKMSIKIRCKNRECRAVFIVEESDSNTLEIRSSDPNVLYVGYWYVFTQCPVCGTRLQIPTARIPARIRRLLAEKYKQRRKE